MFSSQVAAYLAGIFTGTDYYLALHTENPGTDCLAGELVDGGYIRIITPLSHEGVDEGEIIYNTDAVVFPAGTTDLGQVTHWSLWDQEAEGTPAIYGAFESPVSWNEGTIFSVQSGNISSVFLTS